METKINKFEEEIIIPPQEYNIYGSHFYQLETQKEKYVYSGKQK